MREKRAAVAASRRFGVFLMAVAALAAAAGCGSDNGTGPASVRNAPPCLPPDAKSVEITLEAGDWEEEILTATVPSSDDIRATYFLGTAYPGATVTGVTPGDTVSVVLRFPDRIRLTDTIGSSFLIEFGGRTAGSSAWIGPQSDIPADGIGTISLPVTQSYFVMNTQDQSDVAPVASMIAAAPAPGQTVSCIAARIVVPVTIQGNAMPDPTTVRIDRVRWSAGLAGDRRDADPRPVLVE